MSNAVNTVPGNRMYLDVRNIQNLEYENFTFLNSRSRAMLFNSDANGALSLILSEIRNKYSKR